MPNTSSQNISINPGERLISLFDALPDCIAQFDADLQPVFQNKAYKENIKDIITAIFQKTKPGFTYEIINNLWMEELRKVLLSGKRTEFVADVNSFNNKRYFNLEIIPGQVSENKKAQSLLVIARDLTELKTSEKLLDNAEIIGQTGNYEFDLITKQFRFSDQMYRILGYEPNAFEPTLEIFNVLLKQEYALSVPKKINNPEDLKQNYETVQKVFRADGEHLHILSKGYIFYNDEGNAVKIVGNAKDITEQVKANVEKERAENAVGHNLYFIETLTKATPGIISITDLHNQSIVYMNRNVYELLGYTSGEFEDINNQWELLHPGDMQLLEKFKTDILKASDDEIIELEWRLKAKDESWQWIHSTNKVFNRDLQGKPKQYISVANFITEKKKAEEELSLLRIKDVLNAIITAQEEERARIAEALHNDLGQLLYITKIKLNADKNEAAALLNKAIEKARTISFELMPSILQDYGLDTAIKDLVKQLKVLGLEMNYTNSEAFRRIDKDLEISIFRIIQELTNNIIKHSKAKKARLDIYYSTNYINIFLTDEGIGFDTAILQLNKKGFGIRNIKNRLTIFNGNIFIRSSAGQGTYIKIKIPFTK